LHVFQWPSDGRLFVPGLRNKVERAFLLADADRNKLAAELVEDGVVVRVPETVPDSICSVVALEVAGELDIEAMLTAQQPDGTIKLAAVDATCHGQQLRYESGHQRDNIGFWLDPKEWVDWRFKVTKPGKFTVSAEIAALGSGSFQVVLGDQTVKSTAPTTGDYGRFQVVDLGELRIDAAGVSVLAVKPVPEGWQPLNLKSITLRPVP
jgi:alpha-L-fucosidase